ncbi:MAG: N-formylglutamate amidohydrolase [Rhodospirillales bacterium]|nr:N-formylglutamate amidohydrolase [Rhodospirillaceae bacterium]MDP6642535.1 N-formylglutamate amidohydrolase [Rhodospirillales bacterium]MDP6841862.1 N-formylglutamate amidohydrolase [Rhodospirillales bacterium]
MDQLATDRKTGRRAAAARQPFEIDHPKTQSIPFVFASPHSGRDYPENFIAESRLDALALRKSEDSFVEELFADAPQYGAPLLKALFPRAYVDPNREAWELDPRMFTDKLPPYVNTSSARVFAGLGTVARVVCNGEEIYHGKIKFAEAKRRIESTYVPYHAALTGLIEETRDRFGRCILIDCHSMPSVGGPMDRDHGTQRVDFVLGDNHGETCTPELIELVDGALKSAGYAVRRNNPYSGGYTTRHYGQPRNNVEALQIEINRHLYMDEARIERRPGFTALKGHLDRLMEKLASAGFSK